jgi:nitronate monooxygenase
MQSISTADFVSKVCNAGGLGFITAETFETPDHLREELRKMSSLTDKPFGVNISLIPEFDVGERTLRFVDVVCEEGVPVIETAPPRRGKTHRSCHFPRGIYQFPLYRT